MSAADAKTKMCVIKLPQHKHHVDPDSTGNQHTVTMSHASLHSPGIKRVISTLVSWQVTAKSRYKTGNQHCIVSWQVTAKSRYKTGNQHCIVSWQVTAKSRYKTGNQHCIVCWQVTAKSRYKTGNQHCIVSWQVTAYMPTLTDFP